MGMYDVLYDVLYFQNTEWLPEKSVPRVSIIILDFFAIYASSSKVIVNKLIPNALLCMALSVSQQTPVLRDTYKWTFLNFCL